MQPVDETPPSDPQSPQSLNIHLPIHPFLSLYVNMKQYKGTLIRIHFTSCKRLESNSFFQSHNTGSKLVFTLTLLYIFTFLIDSSKTAL